MSGVWATYAAVGGEERRAMFSVGLQLFLEVACITAGLGPGPGPWPSATAASVGLSAKLLAAASKRVAEHAPER